MLRRDLLGTGLMLCVAGALGEHVIAAPQHRTLGLQLFTLMVPLERDFEGTLKAVADMGYREVETIGSFGRDPKQVRELLDRYRLVSPSQHLVPGELYGLFSQFTQRRISEQDVHKRWLSVMSVDRVVPIIEEGINRATVLGQQYLVWQIIWPEQMATRESLDAFCRAMNTAGELCAKAGLTFNFHNQGVEFGRVNGYVPYDVIIGNTDPRTVKLEMDVYWALAANADPIAYFTRNPGRYRQCHLKDGDRKGNLVPTGTGVVDFGAVILAAERSGVKHYYFEYDRSDDPLRVTKESFEYLRTYFSA